MALTITGDCPACGHAWSLHPVAADVWHCAQCIYEEDVDERAAKDMCEKTPPIVDAPAADFVSVRERPGLLGRRTVELVDHSGQIWRTVRGRHASAGGTRDLRRHIQEEVERSTLAELWRTLNALR